MKKVAIKLRTIFLWVSKFNLTIAGDSGRSVLDDD